MKDTLSKQPKQGRKQKPEWPREVQPGRAIVRVYQRKTPAGYDAYLVANYDEHGKRRFDCYSDPDKALEAATKLAERIDARDFHSANMTREESLEYVTSVNRLKKWPGVTVDRATAVVAECLELLGDLGKLSEAARFYAARHKPTTAKTVAKVVEELLKVKKARTKKGRPASDRYRDDLKSRLERFAEDCQKDCCNVTTSDIQAWLDGLKRGKENLSPQSYRNYRTVLFTLFKFAVARGYAVDNPVQGVEKVDASNGNDIEIFTPVEMQRLLAAASANYPDFLPCIALGAFAGLRSAELERLAWEDIDLTSKDDKGKPTPFIKVAASKAKTASRRIVPISDNLAEWLQTYANREGKVWRGTHYEFYDMQEAVAAATAVEADEDKGIKALKPVPWRGNALRHSYASYRFAQTSDAGRVAGELGNSAAVVHKHYRELVKPAEAARWFAIQPAKADNVVPMVPAAAVASV